MEESMLMDGIEFQKWNWPKRIKLTNLDDIHDTNEMYHMEMEGFTFKNLPHGWNYTSKNELCQWNWKYQWHW